MTHGRRTQNERHSAASVQISGESIKLAGSHYQKVTMPRLGQDVGHSDVGPRISHINTGARAVRH